MSDADLVPPPRRKKSSREKPPLLLILRRTRDGIALIPAARFDVERLNELLRGVPHNVERKVWANIEAPRSLEAIKLARFLEALIGKVAEATGQPRDLLRYRLKKAAGLLQAVALLEGGGEQYIAKSFNDLDEAEFREAVDRICLEITTHILPGVSTEMIFELGKEDLEEIARAL